ncbi:hypothetical protein [Nonomuraea fuscirosea]|uniref:hypothetical protein n=1 Tax=Nonomuraea fuscirosea TaxID=1291556 RepID=UPI003426AA64
MAVPPIQRPPHQARLSNSWLLDIVLGLLVVASLPLAVVSIPNTLSVVARLLPDDLDQAGLMRTNGLSLPALMLTVPLVAAALRRVPAPHLLLGGLVLVALSEAAGGYAGSEFFVGVVRVLRGVGAGVILAATLAAVWHRAAALRALWAGMFGLSLLTAQALALWPLDAVSSWRVTLQPYPLVTGVALGLAAVHLVVWTLGGRPAGPVPSVRERGRLLLTAVPAAGIAALAISTATEGWRAVPVMVLAVVAILGLLALASIGSSESRTSAYTMVAVGAVLLPSAAQVTLVEMGGLGGPGLRGLWVPYAVAGVLAIVAAVAVRLFAQGVGRRVASLGLLAMVAGLCSVRLVVPAADGMVLTVPFSLLAVGAAVAVTAALQGVGAGAAMSGLSLGCAGVLAGFLLGAGVQMAMLDGVRSAQELVDSFVGALHWWALAGGFLLVMIIVLAAVMARRPGRGVPVDEPEGPGTPPDVPCAGLPPADVLLVRGADQAGPDGDGAVRPDGDDDDPSTVAIPRVSAVTAGPVVEPAAGVGGVTPAVPPQGQSPEDAGSA